MLALPTKGAINFHDGPLPKYAGLNATTWAILNGETRHGITWHEMKAKVDEGDILKQSLFDIGENATSLTLNARCFEVAQGAFAELVDELANGTNVPQPQDISELTYFGKFKRPNNAGVISWNESADTISALVRALDFGPYTNPLNSAKVKIGAEYFVVEDVSIVESSSAETPGSIMRINEDGIMVSTSTNEVLIKGLRTIDGQGINLSELNLTVGSVIGSVSSEDSSLLNEINERICRKEIFWKNRLKSLEFIDLHYASLDNQDSQEHKSIDLNISSDTMDKLKSLVSDPLAGLTAAFGMFIGKHGGKNNYDLGLGTAAIENEINGFDGLFASRVPFRVSFDSSESFADTSQKLTEFFAKTQDRITYSRDITSRHPELHRLTDRGVINYPVSVELVNSINDKVDSSAILNLVITDDASASKLVYDSMKLSQDQAQLMADQFMSFLEQAVSSSNEPLSTISFLTADERQRLIHDWNNTKTDFPSEKCIHQLFEDQVIKTPNAVAAFCKGKELTYVELNAKANQLGHVLGKLGVGPESMVGVCLNRSLDLLVAILAVQKAGGAYVPLDPKFPKDRIAYMIDDAECQVLITEEPIKETINTSNAKVVCVDTEASKIATESTENIDSGVKPDNLAYVIYTSGSTGNPKGVMVMHKNAVNFFTGMDEYIPHEKPGVWLAVTSLSFDISVLELFWPLKHGFKIVINTDEEKTAAINPAIFENDDKSIDFGLFYFSSDEGERAENKYKLLLEGAKFGDKNGFSSVWTPERHFYNFGGLYPNPSVTSAAIAAVTDNIKIRSGSCVSPLHSPIRIAEEWSVVDNISNGRVGIGFAAGWMPRDFVLMPQNFADRKNVMFDQIKTVKKLWRGEKVAFTDAVGKEILVNTLPRPVQEELPVWITVAGNPETFQMAGEAGYNILTHLLGQTFEDVAEKIAIYRKARKEAGHAGDGLVSLMLHTFVGDDDDKVKEIVRAPMKHYLKSSVNLVKAAAWSFPTMKKTTTDDQGNFSLDNLTEEEIDAVMDHSFERYYDTAGLFGTPETCLKTVDKIKGMGVDEIACLIDFGVDSDEVLESLNDLNEVRAYTNRNTALTAGDEDYSIPSLIESEKVTHLQCTPSMAKMLTMDKRSENAIKKLENFLVGGEAFPVNLAKQLSNLVEGNVFNMYGPTETTIWSTTSPVKDIENVVPIGRPIANTDVYVVDSDLNLVPVGVPGELCIGGEGVVRGYYKRPELTAERFVNDHFKNDDDARMYRTGDLVRYRPDGVIDYIGRIDHQVKVRGYRIELGEIETILSEYGPIQEAVVIARKDIADDPVLVAYYIPKEGKALPDADMKAHLGEKLPDYMVPGLFASLSEFPLTPNGKIDRKALPKPSNQKAEASDDFVAASTEVETELARMWSKVLGVDNISVNDNFFTLGGHSLSAVQVTYQINQKFNVEISLPEFFKTNTIKGLAGIIDSKVSEQGAKQEQAANVQDMLSKVKSMSQEEIRAMLDKSKG